MLNDLVQRAQGHQVDIATAYFSIRSFELLRHTLPGVRHFRWPLGDKPLEGEDGGLRPDSAACLQYELNAELFPAATLRPAEELLCLLRREEAQ